MRYLLIYLDLNTLVKEKVHARRISHRWGKEPLLTFTKNLQLQQDLPFQRVVLRDLNSILIQWSSKSGPPGGARKHEWKMQKVQKTM